MKRLGLLRHAKSDMDDAAPRDFDRGLNDRGRRGAALIGQHIAGLGIAWEAVIASPAARVRRTLEASGLAVAPQFEERAYLADAPTLIELLRQVEGDPVSVLVAGHNPGLHELLFRLVDPDHETALFARAAEKFPTASFALLELRIDKWADLAPGCGTLVHFARPRDLDPELGPERVG
uniref:SixA phosphatase family protein n=1 Tax=Altererythrobacter segetis TaxID=1104773 RepID=UPI00140AC1D7|nr:histidine phosphatase family protein [Altererythrobacter segetis]